MADVFLTYAPADAELALRVSKGLERAGLTVTRGPTQYVQDWAVRVFDALDASSAVVALWSRDAMNRDWIACESAIAAHFGQLVSVRVDPALPRDMIPAAYRDSDGSLTDIFETDIAPSGWTPASVEALDRSLAPVSGKIRALKARGPVAAPIVDAGAVAPAEDVQRKLAQHFAYLRRDGAERNGKSLPALAATRRESAFRASYEALELIEFPADVRASLIDFADPATSSRGLGRLYAEALSRNDKEFWGHVGRMAAPVSASLCLAGLQRSGASNQVVNELLDPRDPREIHGERFGRARGAKKVAGASAGGAGGVVLWPMAAVAVGVAALVAMPHLSKIVAPPSSDRNPRTAESTTLEPRVQTAEVRDAAPIAPPPIVVPIPERAAPNDTLRATGPAPVQVADNTPIPTTVKAIPTPPSSASAPVETSKPAPAKPVVPATPPQVQVAGNTFAPSAPAPAPVRTAASTPSAGTMQIASAEDSAAQALKMHYCRLEPGPSEYTVEVLPSEDLAAVAQRVALGSKDGMRLIASRNTGCLSSRSLALADGRQISGASLLFPGDRLVIPGSPLLNSAQADETNPAL